MSIKPRTPSLSFAQAVQPASSIETGMPDKLTPERRSANMRQIAAKHTKPEMIVRKIVHRMGYRFRLHAADLPGKPDIVLRSRKKIILVHGCFWHQHSQCSEGRVPGTRQEYWIPKLERNVARDRANRRLLSKLGWRTVVVWECQLSRPDAVEKRIRRFLTG